MGLQKKVIWLAWQFHRRTVTLCDFIEIDPFLFVSNHPRIIKHPLFILKTIKTIFREKPKTLIVQNPSIFLTLLACIFKPLLKYVLIVDTHNVGILPDNNFLKRCEFLYRYMHRCADLTIVTNQNLAKIILKNKGNAFVLPDRLPFPLVTEFKRKEMKYQVVVINTFGKDEPYREIFKIAQKLPIDIKLYMSGNKKNISADLIKENEKYIHFTGFLSELEYWNLLASADLIIDLTYREDCLVCGAYEAVALAKPLILSNTKALKLYFYKGVIFTSNNPEGILRSVVAGIKNLHKLQEDMKSLKAEISERWQQQGNAFKTFLHKR